MSLSSLSEELFRDDNPAAARKSRRLRTIVAVLAALAIVVSAWYIRDTQGFDQINQTGPTTALLPGIGEPAPDFTMTVIDQHGRPSDRIRLSQFEGQPVWLNFWGSWCPPCRAEMPDIQSAYEEVGPQGLVWLAVSLNEPAKDAAEFAAANDATFTIASDPNRVDTGASYPVAYFPTHILIDEQGIVRDIVIGGVDREDILKRADQILTDAK